MPEPPELERFLGMDRYASEGPGIGGRLRERPEDFVVDEIPKPPAPAQGKGKYTIVTLRATDWETNRLVRELGRSLGVGRRGVFFTGTKDKRAVKTQQMAIAAAEEDVKALRLSGVEVLATYRADRAPKLGDLIGNRFDIAVTHLDVDAEEAEARCKVIAAELGAAGGMPNYFGLQRFGSLRPITQRVGERIVRGDFEGAVMAYVAEPQPSESPEAFEARRRVGEERDFRKAVAYYPSRLTFERVLLQHLAESPDDWTGALRKLPQNLVTMFVYAYQSLLFNRLVSERLRAGQGLRESQVGDILVPVDADGVPDHDTLIPVGGANLEKCRRQAGKGRAAPTAIVFGMDAPFAEGAWGEAERRVVGAEGLVRDDFAIPAMPELASFGQRRAMVVDPGDFAMERLDAGMRFTFRLPKGSYATCLQREYMKAEASHY